MDPLAWWEWPCLYRLSVHQRWMDVSKSIASLPWQGLITALMRIVHSQAPVAPLSFSCLWHMFICVSLTCGSCCGAHGAAAFDPERQRMAPARRMLDAHGEGMEVSGLRLWRQTPFWSATFQSGVRATNLRDLHVKRGHGGVLVDVPSLGMSVIYRHRRMEGREELWRSCENKNRGKNLKHAFLNRVNSPPTRFNLNSSYMERQWLMVIFQQTHPNETSLNALS